MVNIEDFIKRLEIILEYYGLNASAFADKIGVQRSSLSHLLSGRNKPSLDFILKILDVFPDVDIHWLLNGKGSFPKNEEEIQKNKVLESFNMEIPTPIVEHAIPKDLFSEVNKTNSKKNDIAKNTEFEKEVSYPNSNEVMKIVFFYKNGTFKEFVPN